MTTAEMITELRRSLGNRNDIDDDRYLMWLNWAMYDVAGFHGKRAFRMVRFKELEKVVFKTVEPLEFTGVSISADGYIIFTTGLPTDEYMLGQTISFEDFSDLNTVISAVDNNAEIGLLKSIEAASDGKVHPCIFAVDDVMEDSWTIDRITDVTHGTTLKPHDWQEIMMESTIPLGTSTKFGRRGRLVYLDGAVEERTVFKIYTYTTPPLLTIGEPEREPILPQRVHETIILGAMWRGHDKIMEPERANAAREKYVSELTQRLNDSFLEDEYTERQFRVRRR